MSSSSSSSSLHSTSPNLDETLRSATIFSCDPDNLDEASVDLFINLLKSLLTSKEKKFELLRKATTVTSSNNAPPQTHHQPPSPTLLFSEPSPLPSTDLSIRQRDLRRLTIDQAVPSSDFFKDLPPIATLTPSERMLNTSILPKENSKIVAMSFVEAVTVSSGKVEVELAVWFDVNFPIPHNIDKKSKIVLRNLKSLLLSIGLSIRPMVKRQGGGSG